MRCDNGDSKLLHKLVNESIAAHGLVNILEWPSLQTGRHSWFVFPVFWFGSQYQWPGKTGSWLQMKITNHFRGIYRHYPNLIKENWRMWTCNWLDLQTLGSQPVMLKNLPDHWRERERENTSESQWRNDLELTKARQGKAIGSQGFDFHVHSRIMRNPWPASPSHPWPARLRRITTTATVNHSDHYIGNLRAGLYYGEEVHWLVESFGRRQSLFEAMGWFGGQCGETIRTSTLDLISGYTATRSWWTASPSHPWLAKLRRITTTTTTTALSHCWLLHR